jgi:MFS transporter, Spinster family, sphingosine-1-phosphate transporter
MSRRLLPAIRSPGAILCILTLINLINYVDRQIISPLVPLLAKPVAEGGLGLADVQAGLLQFAFMVVHSVASIPLGVAADRFMRTRLIAIGVGVWSLATGVAAFARGFTSLFVSRALVGAGEATYAPAASALISERFKPEKRATAMGIFQSGMMVGGVVAVLLGGWIGEHHGWRAAFLLVGAPGLLLTGLALLIYEGPREGVAKPSLGLGAMLRESKELLAGPAVRWINIAGVLITFMVGALVFFGPSFILRYHYGNDTDRLAEATATFGTTLAPAVIIGTIAGAAIADRLEKTRPGAGRLLTIALGTLVAAPLALIGIWAEDLWLVNVAIGLGVFFASFYVGPILAALHDVVPEHQRGAATGLYLLLIHLLGDAISPTIVGGFATLTGSLRVGLSVSVLALAVGGLAALRAIVHVKRAQSLWAERQAR